MKKHIFYNGVIHTMSRNTDQMAAENTVKNAAQMSAENTVENAAQMAAENTAENAAQVVSDTLNLSDGIVSAMAVEGDRIIAVGSDASVTALADDGDEITDLEGRAVFPGFNDSHCHVFHTGLKDERLDLYGVQSMEEIIERGRIYIEERHLAEGEWVIGGGFDQNVFDNPVLPDGKVLEAISSKHPILIERVCGHVGAANALALKMTGFSDGPEITGGIFDRDDHGRLTGVIRESALDQFKLHVPKLDVEGARRVILNVLPKANAAGLTSMQSDDSEGAPFEVIRQAYESLEAEGKLTVRIFEEIERPRPQVLREFLKLGLRTGDGSPYFKVGNIKLITDGSLGARTAAMREGYGDDPGNRGIYVYTQEDMDEMVMLAHEAGLQVAAHAIGDGSIEQCIRAFAKAWQSDHKDLRNRVVHCQFLDEEMMRMMAENHVCADIQPPFVPSDMGLVASRVGERVKGYPWKALLKHGIHLGGGSDSPVETFDPIWGIHCAVNRTDADFAPEGGWHPEEKLSVQEAVALYTTGGAYVSLEEDVKGKLEPGYYADFVVLDQDLFAIVPEKIKETRVLATYVGGRCVYAADR